MFGLIGSQAVTQLEFHLEESIVYQSQGVHILEELQAAARVQLRTLIVELHPDTEKDLIQGIRHFRMQRPNARILIFAPNRQPGDATLAQIVALGIYDIIAPEIDPEGEDAEDRILSFLLAAIHCPASFADATRWGLQLAPPTETKAVQEKKEIKERIIQEVVIQERMVGTPVIVVAGANRGSGCTYVSLQLALYVQQLRKRVLLVELITDKKVGSSINPLAVMQEGEIFKAKGIEHVDLTVARKLTHLKKLSDYDCIIIDSGYWKEKTPEVMEEWSRATLSFLTLSSAPWSYVEFVQMYESLGEREWSVLLQHPSKAQMKSIQQELKVIRKQGYDIPYQPDPFFLSINSEDKSTIWAEILFDLFPIGIRKQKSWIPKIPTLFARK